MATPISFCVGNANNGYCLELTIKSFVKHNGIPDEILISDNSSTDFSLDFISDLSYSDIITILPYNDDYDKNSKEQTAFFKHIHIGLNSCRNKWALLTHVDTNWKAPVIPIFEKILFENPDLFMSGIGGGNPNGESSIIHNGTTNGTRFHEWLLFINVPEWKSFGVGFNSHLENKIFFDTGSWLYNKAWNAGKKLVTIDPQESDGPYITNFVAGGRSKKEQDSLKSKEILQREYWL
jgi:hypothetical protein